MKKLNKVQLLFVANGLPQGAHYFAFYLAIKSTLHEKVKQSQVTIRSQRAPLGSPLLCLLFSHNIKFT